MRKITMIAVGTATALATGLALAGPGLAPAMASTGPTTTNFSITGGILVLTTPGSVTFPAVTLGTATTGGPAGRSRG